MAQYPIRETDDEARALARQLIAAARHGALAVRDPESGHPVVSRVAVATDPEGRPVSLVSDLSHHTQALKADPACSLLLGEPGPRGDPLTHPRITLIATARFLRHGAPGHADLAAHYLTQQPKAQLYIGFADFSFLRFEVSRALLNGGFGKAYMLQPADLAPGG
ncbi:pyridoxamine 5-phosphate oxidase [Rhodosalinus halophilus]|uniref:Pyridoxamine 5-phosphate oxidase n=1 Tax=Rhodosalinus halophilus TaxID=2259333 RepID=A0A365U7Z2_9RHOB|nr:pyridoxamine 5'-phosphate oxidase family protein [Rhodosalinus halophilus]RBI84023.1 pyridoxamine 5-phosphate oxidase [Rhodosalinus halophilus]